jgi:hypothetical protein
MKLPEIVVELAAVYHKEAFNENRVKYWEHQLQIDHSNLRDRLSSGKPPLKIPMPDFCHS